MGLAGRSGGRRASGRDLFRQLSLQNNVCAGLGAIGALQGQAVLCNCLPLIESLAAGPVADETGMESFLPFLDIASARHAQADLRLFAN